MPHCDEGLKEIYQAIIQYQQQNQGAYPPNLETLVESELLSPWLLVCPASEFGVGECSYIYRAADLPPQLSRDAAKNIIIAYDKKPWHKKRRNILFADGQIQRLPEKIYSQFIKKDNQLRETMDLEPIVE
ncbi:MAG: hypothetical protein JW936_02355 [Sedimentisphaerales bacterium]|nr:hypothetical protein [Sedimentisphaerales bacterium]